MRYKPDQLSDFHLFYGRFASWVVHHVLKDDRRLITEALSSFLVSGFLERPPSGYMPRSPVYYSVPCKHDGIEGLLGLVVAADEPGSKPANIMILAVQVPVSPQTAVPAHHSNCHLTTEIYPAGSHSIIPVSYEFARGTTPGKRLNYTVDHRGVYDILPEKVGVVTGFKHFLSIAYSQFGVASLEFVLNVRHRPPSPAEPTDDKFPTSRGEFLSKLRQEVSGPLFAMELEILEDSGLFAPDSINPGAWLDDISTWVGETAYQNLSIFRQELDSNINPRLLDEKPQISEETFGLDVQVPEKEKAPLDQTSQIARTLAQYRGALATVFLLAEQGYLDKEELLQAGAVSEEDYLETLGELRRANLIVISKSRLWLAPLGDVIIGKLNRYTSKAEFVAGSWRDAEAFLKNMVRSQLLRILIWGPGDSSNSATDQERKLHNKRVQIKANLQRQFPRAEVRMIEDLETEDLRFHNVSNQQRQERQALQAIMADLVLVISLGPDIEPDLERFVVSYTWFRNKVYILLPERYTSPKGLVAEVLKDLASDQVVGFSDEEFEEGTVATEEVIAIATSVALRKLLTD